MDVAQPIREQAALYLQIQQWLDLEAKVRELTAQLERSTTAELAADVRAATATQEAVLAKAELEAANQRIKALMAAPEGDEGNAEAMTALAQANTTIAELTRQLATRAPEAGIITQAVAELKAAQASLQPGPQAPAEFELFIHRNSEGFLRKIDVKEKR